MFPQVGCLPLQTLQLLSGTLSKHPSCLETFLSGNPPLPFLGLWCVLIGWELVVQLVKEFT